MTALNKQKHFCFFRVLSVHHHIVFLPSYTVRKWLNVDIFIFQTAKDFQRGIRQHFPKEIQKLRAAEVCVVSTSRLLPLTMNSSYKIYNDMEDREKEEGNSVGGRQPNILSLSTHPRVVSWFFFLNGAQNLVFNNMSRLQWSKKKMRLCQAQKRKRKTKVSWQITHCTYTFQSVPYINLLHSFRRLRIQTY